MSERRDERIRFVVCFWFELVSLNNRKQKMRANIYIASASAWQYGVKAHIRMQSPPPFGELMSNQRPNLPHPLGVNKDNLNEYILFPCQLGPSGNYDFTRATTVAAGDYVLMSFIGEIINGVHTAAAVHGGGSCQVSLAKTSSQDPKDWKVIQTYIGGCPATAQGNLESAPWTHCSSPDSEETECLKSYNVRIPSEVPAGQYFFAWTWFNRLGNREMYMQCAPLNIIGGGADETYLDSLPSVFVANENGENSTCRTEYGGVLGIVNPGLSVKISQHETDTVVDAVFEPCRSVYGNPDTAPNAPAQSPAESRTSNTGAPTSSPTSPPPVYQNSSTTAPSRLPGYTAVPKPSTPSSGGESKLCVLGELFCPEHGRLVCLSPFLWGLCDRGCVRPQVVAAGTKCENGSIGHM
jgi:hypothetical protein